MEVKTRVGGSTIFWTLYDTPRAALAQALADQGLASMVRLPDVRTGFAALQMALKDLAESYTPDRGKSFIRPLAGNTGFDVRIEHPRFDKNEMQHAFSVSLGTVQPDNPNNISILGDSPLSYQDVVLAMSQRKAEVPGASLTAMLVKFATEVCHGTALRHSGGIYWVSARYEQLWLKMAKAVEQANQRNICYRMQPVMDADSVKAIHAAITSEVQTSVADFEREFELDGEDILGPRALQTRSDKARWLAQKVAEYEADFSMSLSNLKTALGAVEARAAELALQRSAEDGVMLTQ